MTVRVWPVLLCLCVCTCACVYVCACLCMCVSWLCGMCLSAGVAGRSDGSYRLPSPDRGGLLQLEDAPHGTPVPRVEDLMEEHKRLRSYVLTPCVVLLLDAYVLGGRGSSSNALVGWP